MNRHQIKNPYLKPSCSQLVQPCETNHNFRNPHAGGTSETMGIQSQRRDGAIAKCKKRASKHTLLKRASSVVDSFDPFIHCRVCKAKNENIRAGKVIVRLPKRPHHPRCARNRKTRGITIMSMSVTKETDGDLPNVHMLSNKAQMPKDSQPSIGSFFALPPNPTVKQPTMTKDIAAPHSLRVELDKRMETLQKDHAWAVGQKFPAALAVMVEYICSLFEHKKPSDTSTKLPSTTALDNAIVAYRQFFTPGLLSFTFEKDLDDENCGTSPWYHSLEGTKFFLVDWKLAFPSADIVCFNCNGHLHHERTNLSKNKKLFPLWTSSGRPSWCVVMSYKCQRCNITVAANDGRLLSKLNRDVASAYPVEPIYASGTFHFDQDLSDNLENLMRTYANAKFVSEKLYWKTGKEYERKVHTYLSRAPKMPFITYKDFCGTILPPSPDAIRQYYKDAEYSSLKPYGYSNFDRYECEMQSVQVRKGEKVAFDWTFQTVKNYVLKGAKAVFTGNKGSTKEIITALIVPSTKVENISHGLIQSCRQREEFQPNTVYTDTCPNNTAFWRQIFGSDIEAKLGLFHLVHRIVDTLDKHSELYWQCLTDLKQSLYKYEETDEVALLSALKNGAFPGGKMTDDEIRDLRHSKKWKQRYSPYLRKIIHAGEKIQYQLHQWIHDYKERCDANGRPVFTKNTEKATNEQMKKVHYVSDSIDGQYYKEIPCGPRTTHGLSKWKTDRPESPLEKFHEILAHFANSGMKPELADALTLGGTCEYNVKQRYKSEMEAHQREGIENSVSSVFCSLPVHFDHSYLHFLNSLAKSKTIPPPFSNVRVPKKNNGEVFLAKYFMAEMSRMKIYTKRSASSKMCPCTSCGDFVSSEQHKGTCDGSGLQLKDQHDLVVTCPPGGSDNHDCRPHPNALQMPNPRKQHQNPPNPIHHQEHGALHLACKNTIQDNNEPSEKNGYHTVGNNKKNIRQERPLLPPQASQMAPFLPPHATFHQNFHTWSHLPPYLDNKETSQQGNPSGSTLFATRLITENILEPSPQPFILGQPLTYSLSPSTYPSIYYQHNLSRPDDCCYLVGRHLYCAKYLEYRSRKLSGQAVLGKPPHDSNCPIRLHR